MIVISTARRIVSTAFCAVTLALVGLCGAAEPQWILNRGSASSRTMVAQGSLYNHFGVNTIVPTGSDLTLDLGMKQEERFKATERPFFALRYKAQTTQTIGGLFYTNDHNLSTYTDRSFTSFSVIGDNEWHNLVIDMRETPNADNWTGTITSFRLDPINPSDVNSTLHISRLGFFSSDKDANSFLNEANDAPDFSQDSIFKGPFFKCLIPANTVKDVFNTADFFLPDDAIIDIEKTKNRNAVIVLNGAEVAPLSDATSLGFITYCAHKQGQWRVIDSQTTLPDDAKELANANDILFVVARNLMTSQNGFNPSSTFSNEDYIRVNNALTPYTTNGTIGENVAQLIQTTRELKDSQGSRAEAATLLADGIRDILKTSVKSPYSAEYFKRDRIRVGSWGNFNGKDVDDAYIKSYADCGFDFLIPFVSIPTTELLRLCDKYGVETLVNDNSYVNTINVSREYWDHPSFSGCNVSDEPGSDSYDKLAAICNRYESATGKRAYVNLLPMYANAAQLKFGANSAHIEYFDSNPNRYRNYCSEFCEKFDTDYICTDIYPLNWVSDKKVTYNDYCESINVIASVAREYNRDFWCYIQTFGWVKSKRTPNESEFRWQCYTMLSFGCKTILCWMYAGLDEKFPSLVDVNSQKTRAWYEARPVLHELRRLSDEFVQYRNLGAFSHNCSDKTPYLKFTNEYQDFDTIQKIESQAPILVGCFEKKNPEAPTREKAFTLVNMTNLEDAKGATVRLKLDAKEVVSWYRGVPEKSEPASDGFYEFHLDSGEGVFVVVR